MPAPTTPIRKILSCLIIFCHLSASVVWAAPIVPEKKPLTANPKSVIISDKIGVVQSQSTDGAAQSLSGAQAMAAAAAPAAAPATPVYKFDIISDTQSPLQNLAPVGGLGLPSINDTGKVAFTARYTAGGRPYVVLKDYNNNDAVQRNYLKGDPFTVSNFLQVNNADQIAFQSKSDDGLVSYIDRLDTTTTGNIMGTGSMAAGFPGNFDMALPYPTINNSGFVAMNAFTSPYTFIASRANGGDAFNVSPVLTGNPALFPMVTDAGETIEQFGANNSAPLLYSSRDFTTRYIFASTDQSGGVNTKFSVIGNKPGFSDDGKIIAFMAQHTAFSPATGIYIFLYDAAAGVWRGPAQVAGIPATSSPNYRVGVNKSGTNQYTIAYIAQDGTPAALTLNSVVIDITNPLLVYVSGVSQLARVGAKISSFGFVVQDIQTYDPVNAKGQVAFWVSTTGGKQYVMRATPLVSAGATITQAPVNNSLPYDDPVYLHSGQLMYSHADMTIAGRGMNIAINHSYKGTTATISQFGFGWTMSYFERLAVLANGSAQISDGGGRKDTYTLTAGVYTPPAGFYQTLVKNADSTWTLTSADGSTKKFDTLGRLVQIRDRHANTITLAYTAAKVNIIGPNGTGGRMTLGSDYQLTKITGDNGRAVNFAYNADGLLRTVTDAATARTVTFAYNAVTNDLLSITNPITAQFPAGVVKTFTYDTKHNILTVKDPKGQVRVTNTYTAQNRVATQTAAGFGTVSYAYETNRTTVTDRKGFVKIYDFNTAGNPVRETIVTKGVRTTDPATFATTNTYNTDMEKTTTIFPKHNGIAYAYDSANADRRARGNLLQVRYKTLGSAANNDTNDIFVKYTYEPRFNQIKTMTDANGKVTAYTYDYELATTDPSYGLQGNLVKVQQPAIGGIVPTTAFTYNSFGQLLKITDPNGNVAQMTYDAATGYLLSVSQDPAAINALTKFTYDAFGNINQITNPNNRITKFLYNELGWLISVTDPLNYVTKFTYDANGNVIKQEGQMNTAATLWQTTQYTYDLFNHVKTVTDPLNRVTTFNYDANANLISVVDPVPNTTAYLYDERNLLFKETNANAGVTQYDYDLNGVLIKVTDANARATQYAYDGFNRLIKKTNAVTTEFEQYTYDKNSNLTKKITPNNQTITYTYDGLNRRTAQTYSDTTMNVSFVYDIGSRLTQANNSFSSISYIYDKLNRPTRETQKFGTLTFAVNSVYDKDGNRTKVTYPSGKVVDYTYTALDQMATMNINAAQAMTYTYDTLHRRTAKNLVTTAIKNTTTVYNAANEITSITNQLNPAAALISKYTHTYDKVSNRLTQVAQLPSGSSTTNYTYNKLYELTATTGAQAHTYTLDKVGNRTAADGIAYVTNAVNEYTAFNGIALSYDKNGNLLTFQGATHTYDIENRLKQVSGISNILYTYDSLNRRVSKTVGTAKTFYVHDGDQIIEERNAAGALVADYTYGDGIDEAVSMTRGTQTYYYIYDSLGSVRQLVNAAGTVIEKYDYDPFGKPTVTSTVGNPIMFTGRWYDPETTNYYYRARYYKPMIGRFLQRDPMGYVDGMNLYSYVGNNPINLVDPYGLYSFDEEKFADEIERRRFDNVYVTAGNLINAGGGMFRYPRAGTGTSAGSPTSLLSKLGAKYPIRLPANFLGLGTNALRVAGRLSVAGLIAEGFWDLGIIIEAGFYASDFSDSKKEEPCEDVEKSKH